MSSEPKQQSRFTQQIQFCIKELRETLRDRRTIVTLLLMPMLTYPLMGLGLRFLTVDAARKKDGPQYQLLVSTDTEAQWLDGALMAGERILDLPDDKPIPKKSILAPDDDADFDLSESVADGAADLGVRIQFADGFDFRGNKPAEVEIVQLEDSPLSREAADYVRERLDALNSVVTIAWAKEKDDSFQLPISQSKSFVEAPPAPSAIIGLLPLVLLLMTVTGGVYPAIDLTAGERERDTLETLMALPVAPFRLLLAKYVAVVTVTLLTGAMNLLAMFTTVLAMQLETVLLGPSGLTLALAGKLALVLATFALFYSALLLALTSSTRSFKEAQAYLIPLMLLSISPGLMLLTPGWTLNLGTAAIPIVNMLLLARDVLEGNQTATLAPVLVAVGSTALSAFACLAWAGKVFGTDAVSVGGQGRLGGLFKRPSERAATPSAPLALGVLALLFPLYFTSSGFLTRFAEAGIGTRLAASAILTAVLFAGLPWLVSRVRKVQFSTGFRLLHADWRTWLGALLLGASTWPWIFELFIYLQSFTSGELDVSKVEAVEKLLEQWKAIPLPIIVLTMGVVPGVCEELFFRGFLYSGVRRQFGDLRAVAFTALAFGFFHVVLAGGVAPQRIVPSTLMGLVLGWVAWRANSIWPSILLHVTHNSLLLTIARQHEALANQGIGTDEIKHMPAAWLMAAAVGTVLGVLLVRFGSAERSEGDR